jgi:hypothetical protein
MVHPFQGGCACGAVRYEVGVEPLAVASCHCRDCQYASGGGPSIVVVVPKGAVKITKGKVKDFTKNADNGKPITRQFCAECGTPMFSVPSEGNPISIVKAGTLDDGSWLKPSLTLWTSSAQPWAHIDQSLPTFEKQPG